MRYAARSASRLRHERAETVGPGEVHAWLAELSDPALSDAVLSDPVLSDPPLLDPAELDRAARFARPRDGARFAASRAWLRLVLGRYLDADPADLRFTVGPAGRPALAGHDGDRLQFSLSRSGNRVLIAVSLTAVGADIEIVRPRTGLADLIGSRFTAAEADCIEAGCGGSRERGFYRHWTAKEAYLKATGRGLAGLRATELACGPPDAIRVDGSPAAGWILSRPEADPDCATAIVGCGPVTQCRAAGQ